LERDRERRVPLTLHPGLQIFRPSRAWAQQSSILISGF